MESSITRPIAIVRPARVSMLSEFPPAHRTMRATITLSGIEMPATTVERQLPQEEQDDQDREHGPEEAFAPHRGDALGDVGSLVDHRGDGGALAQGGLAAREAGRCTSLEISTTLPSADLVTARPTDGSPLVRVIEVTGEGTTESVGHLAQGDRRRPEPLHVAPEVAAPPPEVAPVGRGGGRAARGTGRASRRLRSAAAARDPHRDRSPRRC